MIKGKRGFEAGGAALVAKIAAIVGVLVLAVIMVSTFIPQLGNLFGFLETL